MLHFSGVCICWSPQKHNWKCQVNVTTAEPSSPRFRSSAGHALGLIWPYLVYLKVIQMHRLLTNMTVPFTYISKQSHASGHMCTWYRSLHGAMMHPATINTSMDLFLDILGWPHAKQVVLNAIWSKLQLCKSFLVQFGKDRFKRIVKTLAKVKDDFPTLDWAKGRLRLRCPYILKAWALKFQKKCVFCTDLQTTWIELKQIELYGLNWDENGLQGKTWNYFILRPPNSGSIAWTGANRFSCRRVVNWNQALGSSRVSATKSVSSTSIPSLLQSSRAAESPRRRCRRWAWGETASLTLSEEPIVSLMPRSISFAASSFRVLIFVSLNLQRKRSSKTCASGSVLS